MVILQSFDMQALLTANVPLLLFFATIRLCRGGATSEQVRKNASRGNIFDVLVDIILSSYLSRLFFQF